MGIYTCGNCGTKVQHYSTAQTFKCLRCNPDELLRKAREYIRACDATQDIAHDSGSFGHLCEALARAYVERQA